MWFVMLKSSKDRVIGVDNLGQQVPPCVRYGTICLPIRDVVRSVPCPDEWEIGVVNRLGLHGARGVVVPLLAQNSTFGSRIGRNSRSPEYHYGRQLSQLSDGP
jgi:hypothetical protein